MAMRGERELRELLRRVDPKHEAATTIYVRVPACRLLRVAADAEIMALANMPASARARLRAVRYEASGTRGTATSNRLAARLRTVLAARR